MTTPGGSSGDGEAAAWLARTRTADDRLGLFVDADVDASAPMRVRRLEVIPFGPAEGAR